jgi:hypothetical protein
MVKAVAMHSPWTMRSAAKLRRSGATASRSVGIASSASAAATAPRRSARAPSAAAASAASAMPMVPALAATPIIPGWTP